MNERWQKYFMSVAELTASLSYCEKLKVGATAVRDRRIICTGYNGTPPGMDNSCEIEIVDTLGQKILKTKDETEHAERNLIAFAARHGIALGGASLFITHAPCVSCARSVINAGFTEVFWKYPYKNDNGLTLLSQLAIPSYQIID